ncbi:actin interacting protein 2 [Aspergillus luchuensis]|uniref:Actin interacting protein 2 n=1 Tax=Aspergillus kawachii TaxID=1069201 RepID=A0A146FRD8_ASPKA|nr:actin interacting protein 2 [Aspergillus luchuensis]
MSSEYGGLKNSSAAGNNDEQDRWYWGKEEKWMERKRSRSPAPRSILTRLSSQRASPRWFCDSINS